MKVPARARPGRSRRPAFTLIELLVVVAIIAILAGLLMPALSGAKAKGNSIKCLNNARQVALSLTMYAGDNTSQYPARREREEAWPVNLLAYYKVPDILHCPNDPAKPVPRDSAPAVKAEIVRSFIINGFNDWFQSNLAADDYRKFTNYYWNEGMRESAIPQPSETLTFGEKRPASRHVHMDLSQGKLGNDVEVIDQTRHKQGSNFTFADGSSRFLKDGQSISPVNLWAVVDAWRNAPAKPNP